MDKKPNIIYLNCHDAGRYISPYGHSVRTPNLEKLAGESVVFRNAFCAAPTCSASRAALLTGQSSHSAGMLGLAHLGWSLKDTGQLLVHTLKDNGYSTALAGYGHVGYDGAFDEHFHPPRRQEAGMKANDKAKAAAAVAYLEGKPKMPFFLEVGLIWPHRHYGKAEEGDAVDEVTLPLPDTPEVRADIADYNASARQMDECCGEVLDALERSGLAEDTLVIATTDHGIAFPHMKCNLTDHGMGVYLMMRGPGVFSKGKTIEAMVSQIDVYPTLCEYLAIEPPAWLEGKTMMPLIKGEAEEINEEIFAEVTYHAAYEPQRCIRTKHWKYIKRFDDEWEKPVLPNCDDSPSKSLLLEKGWGKEPVAKVQLYDLQADPQERVNLAGEKEHAARVKELDARLTAWMERTDDPILKGPVALPEGGDMAPVDGVAVKIKGRDKFTPKG
jgi:N-sulfoglucosamine sulfohydrolase